MFCSLLPTDQIALVAVFVNIGILGVLIFHAFKFSSQSKSLKNTVAQMTESDERSQMAYLGIESVEAYGIADNNKIELPVTKLIGVNIDLKDPPYFVLRIRNFGKTPAIGAIQTSGICIENATKSFYAEHFKAPSATWPSISIIPPGGIVTITIRNFIDIDGKEITVSDDHVKRLSEGLDIIFIMGAIFYDTFGNRWRFKYRLMAGASDLYTRASGPFGIGENPNVWACTEGNALEKLPKEKNEKWYKKRWDALWKRMNEPIEKKIPSQNP